MSFTDEFYVPDSELNKKHELANDQIIADYKEVFSTPAGKRVLTDILNIARLHAQSMTGNSWTFFYEGQKAIGRVIVGRVTKADPDIYPDILREVFKESNKNG